MAKEGEWNLSLLFKNESEILKYREQVKQSVEKFVKNWKDKKSYLESPQELKKALDEYEQLQAGASGGPDGGGTKDGFYWFLKQRINQSDPKIKGEYSKAITFSKSVDNQLRFFKLSLAKISKEKQNQFLQSKELQKYKHYLERTFNEGKYDLSDQEEKISSLKSIPAYEHWVNMTESFLSKEEVILKDESGKSRRMTSEEIMTLLSSTNKRVRDAAAKAWNEILERNATIAEHEINAILENKRIEDELRKAERPDTLRHINDDVKTEMIDVLIKTVSERNDIPHRLYKLKAQLLKQKKLGYHERNVPFVKKEKDYKYKDAYQLVHKVFKQLDPEFAQILESFSKEGRIDVFPKKGKSDGAFCTDNAKDQPPYIMLNHTNKLSDVRTLAHEMGHGINDILMKPKQNALSYGTTVATAEVASTFMEDFVFEELEKEANDEKRLSLMIRKIDQDISTIFRQIACYRFEQELHEKFRKSGYLSKEEIGKIFIKHMKAYMGPAVEYSKGSENWWVYWSHIRMFFYVYSYASGLLISKSLQARVRQDHKFIKEVKIFLSSGQSKSPEDLFKDLGININDKSFWLQGIKEVETLLNETEALAKKLKKI